jgi:hypothetical protein
VRRDIFPLGMNMVSRVKEMALPKSINQILEMRQMVEIYWLKEFLAEYLLLQSHSSYKSNTLLNLSTVLPTNASSVVLNTFNGFMKNCGLIR